LLRYGKGIVDFDTEVPDRAFDLGVPRQELHRLQVTGTAVDQSSLGSSKRVRTEEAGSSPMLAFHSETSLPDRPDDRPPGRGAIDVASTCKSPARTPAGNAGDPGGADWPGSGCSADGGTVVPALFC
jgi:hypothetical protein